MNHFAHLSTRICDFSIGCYMKRIACSALSITFVIVALFCVPVRADEATDLNSQCVDAMRADDWGTASAYCQEAYEALMRDSHAATGKIAYEERGIADIALGAAGYANLHFDPNTGQDQVSRAMSDMQDMLNDNQCPQSEKTFVAKMLPMLRQWAAYQEDDSL